MGKKAAAATASNRDDRQSSESGADNDDHDHDHDNDHDHDHDQDHEQDHNGGDEATPVKRKRLTQACDPCRKKKIKCGMSFFASFCSCSILFIPFLCPVVSGSRLLFMVGHRDCTKKDNDRRPEDAHTTLKAVNNLLWWDTFTRDRLVR